MNERMTTYLNGFILVHEHLSIDHGQKDQAQTPWDDELRGRSVRALQQLASLGCSTIIDCTPPGYGREVSEVRRASEIAGVRVLVATGSFCEEWGPLPALVEASDVEGLARYFTDEIETVLGGRENAIIKTATSAGTITPREACVLQAAGRAAHRTGVRIVQHTSGGMGPEGLAIYADEGVPPSQVLVSHVCSSGESAEYAEFVAGQGAFVGFDRVGHTTHDDEHWLSLIQRLSSRGLLSQILLSHDSVQRFRGPDAIARHTFDDPTYIPLRFAEAMEDTGFYPEQVRQVLVDNPARWLAIS